MRVHCLIQKSNLKVLGKVHTREGDHSSRAQAVIVAASKNPLT